VVYNYTNKKESTYSKLRNDVIIADRERVGSIRLGNSIKIQNRYIDEESSDNSDSNKNKIDSSDSDRNELKLNDNQIKVNVNNLDRNKIKLKNKVNKI